VEVRIPVREQTHISQCRRGVASLAAELQLGETGAGRAAVIATELAGNLLKHGGGGEFLAGERELGTGLYMLALDRGPGIANLREALRDGFSTSGSPGTGLGAVRRMADTFDIFSQPAAGTAVSTSVGPSGTKDETLAVVGSAMPGEEVSGDGWAAEQSGNTLRLLIADGLGHGPLAAEAAQQAATGFGGLGHLAPEAAIAELHRLLRPTRGAAIALAQIDFQTGKVLYAGVGNVSGIILSGAAARHMVSMAGTAGHTIQRIQQFEYDLPPDALLLMHSDGLRRHWNLDSYPGLAQRSPRVVAGVLYRDFTRGRDDVIVAAVRRPSGEPA
jgi:anti-sigma regulatory factor (Ser/Thr protein kinase)